VLGCVSEEVDGGISTAATKGTDEDINPEKMRAKKDRREKK
jgi:hypothetical protein